jgi:hypothetical protein
VEALNAEEMAWLQLPDQCGDVRSSGKEGLSQRECFERNPSKYLARVLRDNRSNRPGLVVAYAATAEQVKAVLHKYGYATMATLQNCHFQTDDECALAVWARA